MTRVAGIDGCRIGWVAILGENPKTAALVHLTALEGIASHTPTHVAIDMPLGLGDGPRRRCEAAARALLPQGRKSSVFAVPARDILDDVAKGDGHARANALSKARHGVGLPIQTWGLWDKLKEANGFLARADRPEIHEAHPELAFHARAKGRDLGPKRSRDGRAARTAILRAEGFTQLGAWIDQRPRAAMAEDDILDACAVFLTAMRIAAGKAAFVPRESETNALGQIMRIWF